MKERPILFSGAMVRAILEGRKTQTRRLVKPQPPSTARSKKPWCSVEDLLKACPYGVAGDRLWVRETFANNGYELFYRADGVALPPRMPSGPAKWKPSIFMPRAACRLVLEVTAVRVERLQEISGGDAWAEGVSDGPRPSLAIACYRRLWDSLNAKRAPWASNPWVWVLTFSRPSFPISALC